MLILVQFGKGNIGDLLIFSADLTSYLHIFSDLLVSRERESSRAGQEGAGPAGQWWSQGPTQISINTKSRSQQTMQTINRYSLPPDSQTKLEKSSQISHFGLSICYQIQTIKQGYIPSGILNLVLEFFLSTRCFKGLRRLVLYLKILIKRIVFLS